MAAGSAAVTGHGARSSSNASLAASLDRRFQGISNTMESIQSLSGWCIENKKQSSLVVRSWMKWLKKSDNNHRLNLFYLANDVIQNCKRKNAIVFRSAFAEVLPNAALLIKDAKVRKSVERILSIWEERSVYPEELLTQLKANLHKKEKEREKQKEKEKGKETPPIAAPAKTKAAIKSKIVDEFAPNSLIEQLSGYKQAVAEEDFREKQLAALRLDICSAEAHKRLKDKAGGNKFAKDFEDGFQKLQEFVGFLEEELKTGPSLLESLGNAEIFYEMQYKEVKIVANAYSAFANRVAVLKRKLDSLKSTLPRPEDSPIPSPSEDAPSPTGSDSPLLAMSAARAQVDPELDGKAMDEGDLQNDSREEVDVSDEEERSSSITGDKAGEVSPAVVKFDEDSKLPTTPTKALKVNTSASITPATPTSTSQNPSTPLGVNMAKVDLGKISSILSSLTAAMKNTGNPSARPSPATSTTPSVHSITSKATPASPALASILSRVDITPEGILNALSKKNTPALSSLLHTVTNSTQNTRASPEAAAAASSSAAVKTPKAKSTVANSLKRETPNRNRVWERDRQLSPPPPPPPPRVSSTVSPPSLESKINSFLQGNPGFSLALGDASPDGIDGTPVRDEAVGTPTQDEIMDTPGSLPESLGSSAGNNLSPTAYRSEPWDAVITPSGNDSEFTSSRYGGAKRTDEAKSSRKQVISASTSELMKAKKDPQHSQGVMPGGNASAKGEHRLSSGSRKASTGSEEGLSGKREDKLKALQSPGRDAKDSGGYHRIETLVSPCTEGAPIETLGYSNQPLAGERIKTVESIRVIGRDSRRGGGTGGRPGVSMWYEEEEYMEAHSNPPHPMPPPLSIGQGGSGDMPPTVPPPHHLLAHPPPPPTLPHPVPPPPPPQIPFQMLYHTESLQTPPPSHLLLPPPPSPHFFGSPPTIPRPPPPPMSPTLSPSLPPPVMVGGLLVPVDRMQAGPPPGRHDSAERGGPRGNGSSPRPLMSLLGDPPQLPRPGTVKEPFPAHNTPPIHRPGAPGVPPPLLGRVKESPSLHPPPTSPSTPNSPAMDGAPARALTQTAAPAGQNLVSPPSQPRSQPPSPVPLLALPTQRPPLLFGNQRGHHSRHFSPDHQGGGRFRGNKRPGPPFAGGPFPGQKRPFQPPPRY
ncbi:regulation of nuclear pre-mRNA domain-containing protein 2 isoform X2 [Syngnathoides biaculeatus]|uniref:regulation of nuclear pre-mRNA domain-containing protein 2 isoform X2 n=1 Tax=Syngnathoides biaculeatus TaxID=300417 RepID=UPI002ADE6CD1|nr:regulation of nuclear pre-mRNA domain-containing protein 2 isoform X2 [Syngnathoides biaculeatus]